MSMPKYLSPYHHETVAEVVELYRRRAAEATDPETQVFYAEVHTDLFPLEHLSAAEAVDRVVDLAGKYQRGANHTQGYTYPNHMAALYLEAVADLDGLAPNLVPTNPCHVPGCPEPATHSCVRCEQPTCRLHLTRAPYGRVCDDDGCFEGDPEDWN